MARVPAFLTVRVTWPVAPVMTEEGIFVVTRDVIRSAPSALIEAMETVVVPVEEEEESVESVVVEVLSVVEVARARIPPPGVRLTRPAEAAVKEENAEVRSAAAAAIMGSAAAAVLLVEVGWKRRM